MRVVLRAFRVQEKNGNLVVIIYTIIIIIIILLFVVVVYRSICIIVFVTISKQYIVTRVLERPSLHRDKPQS
jgi:flagellar basal body-associated protein FliL